MSVTDRFYDTLFEVSNSYRYEMLQILLTKPMRTTDVANKLGLTSQEISRHASRLMESGLIHKDVEGLFHLTNFGSLINVLLEEFIFASKHREYFIQHTTNRISQEFVKRLGELSESICVEDTLGFLHYIDKLIKDSTEYVWLLVDHYPLTFLGSIIEGLKKGVNFRIIELDEMVAGPHMNLASLEEEQIIRDAKETQLSEQKVLEKIGVFMFISEDRCAIAFPNLQGEFDYKGFIASDERAIKWCLNIFQYHWNKALETTPYHDLIKRKTSKRRTSGPIEVIGTNTKIDVQLLQDAVDLYENVILKGTFNLGVSNIKINNSVRITGELVDGEPVTRLYKTGWSFPSSQFESLFEIDEPHAEVIIENLHFTDFNCTCINAVKGKSLKILNNKFTLETCFGRGWNYLPQGDLISAIWIDSSKNNDIDNFIEGISVQANYFDFAYSQNPIQVSESSNLLEQAEYPLHEYFTSIGVYVNNYSKRIEIVNNTIKNMNGNGVNITSQYNDSQVNIQNNTIYSDLQGSFPFRRQVAGSGIFLQKILNTPVNGTIRIQGNSITFDKPDYCGLIASGFKKDEDTISTLSVSINGNKINLKEGLACINTDTRLQIEDNVFSGRAFFAIMMTYIDKDGRTTNKEAKEELYENQFDKLEIIGPWFRVNRKSPI
ncbi:DUF1724 domain-containing protein [Candidatus Bathyarchaeota archaeon]|nr:MAG: DUF1724 domain-containing protein [Candidatus Bathyarchaeota archaeon]